MKYYTIDEVGKILKVAPYTIRKWIRTNRLRASRMAGSKTVRISDKDIEQFYEDNIINKNEQEG